MPAITILPMDSGYSAILLQDSSISGSQNTNGLMFHDLRELHDQLKLWKVPIHKIPQQDFREPVIIELLTDTIFSIKS